MLDREYHPFAISKPRVPCKLCMYTGIDMGDRMTRTEKMKLESELRRKRILHVPVKKCHFNCLNFSGGIKFNVDLCAKSFNNFHG